MALIKPGKCSRDLANTCGTWPILVGHSKYSWGIANTQWGIANARGA